MAKWQCQVTSTGVLRAGDTMAIDVTYTNTSTSTKQFRVKPHVSGKSWGSRAYPQDVQPGESVTVNITEMYDFTIWENIDFSGVPADGAKMFPVTVKVADYSVGGFNGYEKQIDCGQIELYNEAFNPEIKVKNCNAPSEWNTSKTYQMEATIKNTYREQKTVTVEFESVNKPFDSQTVTLPAGATKTVTGTGSPAGAVGRFSQLTVDIIQNGELLQQVRCGAVKKVDTTEPPSTFSPDNIGLGECGFVDNPPVDIQGPATSLKVRNNSSKGANVTIEWDIGEKTVATLQTTVEGESNSVYYQTANISSISDGRYPLVARVIYNGNVINRKECGEVVIGSVGGSGGDGSAGDGKTGTGGGGDKGTKDGGSGGSSGGNGSVGDGKTGSGGGSGDGGTKNGGSDKNGGSQVNERGIVQYVRNNPVKIGAIGAGTYIAAKSILGEN